MKVRRMNMKVGGLLVVILVVGFLGVVFYVNSGGEKEDLVGDGGQTNLLIKPVFAQSISGNITFLEEEAGISIYANVGSLTLSKAKTAYRTLEKETSDYIVGSLALPNLTVSDDVHCFVHRDGWIVVYYLKTEPMSKIIDWNYYSDGKITKTKLQFGMENMALAIGATVTSARYYNFQYPNANKWMLIAKSQIGSGTDSFNLKMPSEFAFYERSWSHSTDDPGYPTGIYGWVDGSHLKINSSMISTINNATADGLLTPGQLGTDVFHNVSIDCASNGHQAHVGIVLVYREQ